MILNDFGVGLHRERELRRRIVRQEYTIAVRVRL